MNVESKTEYGESPIKPMEAFSPRKELEKIKIAPSKEKKNKLKEFKEKLAYQKEKMAEMQVELIKTIRDNPEITLEEFENKAFEYMRTIGLDQFQYSTAVLAFHDYKRKHDKIREVRERYPDNKKLFEALFGQKPVGKIEVIEKPVTLYLRCENLDDYSRIYSSKYTTEEKLTNEDKKLANMSGGVHISDVLVPGLNDVIIAEKSGFWGYRFKSLIGSESIQKHEEQHAIKRLFENKVNESMALPNYIQAETDSEKELVIKKYLIYDRQYAEERARDEILAYFKMGMPPRSILATLTKPANKGGLYDYMAEQCGEYYHDFNSEWFKKIYEKAFEQVCVSAYQKLLNASIDAFQELLKSDYSVDKAIALLIHEPLSKWSRVVKRLLEQKERPVKGL